MARLPVSKQVNVLSPECTGCLDCVAVCPVGEALNVQVRSAKRVRSPGPSRLAVVLIFAAGYRRRADRPASGRTQISDEEYIYRVQRIPRPQLRPPRPVRTPHLSSNPVHGATI